MSDDEKKGGAADLPAISSGEGTLPATTPVSRSRERRQAKAPLSPDVATMPSEPSLTAPTEVLDQSAAPALTAGVPFGRYQLLRKIATGGMAQLYLSTMQGAADFQKLCVVKKILPHLAEQPHFVNMFLDEARIAATLDHPNIVHIFDLGKVGSAYFIAMEYIAGEDLSHVQKRAAREQRELPIELCCRVIADLCAGLHYAHDQKGADGQPLNIVHRDVSPQNVLITYSGQVKVVDFGIAKAANKAAHTRTGTIMGKSAYMSPEQCLGGQLDRRSDVFAVGVLLFELLTGRRLFKRDNELLTMRAITEDPLPDPGDYRHNLPAELGVIVRRALSRERSQRYATAQELREALERFIAEFGVPASSLELSGLLEDMFPDHIERQSRVREAGSLSEVIAALPSTATGIQDLGTPSASAHRTMTSTEHKKNTLVLALLGVSTLIAAVAIGGLLLRASPAGELVLASTPPGATVRLDGEARGVTPLAIDDLELDHAYQLEVSASGFTTHRENLILTRARPSQEVRLALEELAQPSVGVISISTEPPGATVLLDGKPTGQRTPARLEGVAADLEHQVGLALEGFEQETRRVLLRAGAEQEISLTLTKQEKRPTPRPRPGGRPGVRPVDQPDKPPPALPAPSGTGFITLRTSPWTRVFHGKVDLGDTPLFKLELPAGEVRLRLVNEDKGINEVIKVTIEKDQVTTVDRKL